MAYLGDDSGDFVYSENGIPNFQGSDDMNVANLTDWLMAPIDEKFDPDCKLQMNPNYEIQEIGYDDIQETPDLVSLPNMNAAFLMNDDSLFVSDCINMVNQPTPINDSIPETVECTAIQSAESALFSFHLDSSNIISLASNEPDHDFGQIHSVQAQQIVIDDSNDNVTFPVNAGPSSTSTKKVKPRRRSKAPKTKLYEREEPFEDPLMERNRLNAIKAKRNRLKKNSTYNQLESEYKLLQRTVAEKDKHINELQQTISNMRMSNSCHNKNLLTIKKMVDGMVIEN